MLGLLGFIKGNLISNYPTKYNEENFKPGELPVTNINKSIIKSEDFEATEDGYINKGTITLQSNLKFISDVVDIEFDFRWDTPNHKGTTRLVVFSNDMLDGQWWTGNYHQFLTTWSCGDTVCQSSLNYILYDPPNTHYHAHYILTRQPVDNGIHINMDGSVVTCNDIIENEVSHDVNDGPLDPACWTLPMTITLKGVDETSGLNYKTFKINSGASMLGYIFT